MHIFDIKTSVYRNFNTVIILETNFFQSAKIVFKHVLNKRTTLTLFDLSEYCIPIFFNSDQTTP